MPSALVTGGSSGIGLAIARALREDGYDLTLAARGRSSASRRPPPSSARTRSRPTSRTRRTCVALVAAHVERYGGLDVLVNSAGVGFAGHIADTPTKRFDLQLAVNLRGTFLVTREALPHLRKTRGLVVNLASIAGTIATPGLATYGAAKAAVISLTKSLAREEAPHGVRVTALCPGFVDTRMAEWTGLRG